MTKSLLQSLINYVKTIKIIYFIACIVASFIMGILFSKFIIEPQFFQNLEEFFLFLDQFVGFNTLISEKLFFAIAPWFLFASIVLLVMRRENYAIINEIIRLCHPFFSGKIGSIFICIASFLLAIGLYAYIRVGFFNIPYTIMITFLYIIGIFARKIVKIEIEEKVFTTVWGFQFRKTLGSTGLIMIIIFYIYFSINDFYLYYEMFLFFKACHYNF